MTPNDYINAIRGILNHLEGSQLPAVEQAADLVIDAMTHGGTVHCAAVGHSNEQDFINRAGGLAAVLPFTFHCNINDPVADCLKDRPRTEPLERDLETIRFAIRASNLRAGDVLVLGSVSGKNRAPVEIALTCRELGIKTIGFTSFEYTAQVESLHPSGKKLRDVVDVAIDNGAPYGDAAVDVPGYDVKLLPVSGVSMTVIGWLIWGRVVEKMAAAGNPPSVFISLNAKGGQEFYDKSRAEFNKRGY
ncbi:MAG: sugar isomerase domain-containing protein [Armatimonadota bacterium]